MAETITFSYTESGEDITVTLNENARGPAGPAPSGTGLVSVTAGVLDSVTTLSARVAADASNLRTQLGLGTLATQSGTFSGTSSGTNTGDQNLSGYAPLVSPSFTTPSLGVATATSINGVSITASNGAGALYLGGIIDTRSLTGVNQGGLISTTGETGAAGGYIDTHGQDGFAGGNINTSYGGGAILTSGSGTASGGYIFTFATGATPGGNIDTTAGGSFTTGTGNLTGPASSGTLALTSDLGYVEPHGYGVVTAGTGLDAGARTANTAAFQAALDAAGAVGMSVYISGGPYEINDELVVNYQGQRIFGDAWNYSANNKSRIIQTAVDKPGIRVAIPSGGVTSTQMIVMENFWISGPGSTTSTKAGIDFYMSGPLGAEFSDFNNLKRVRISGFGQALRLSRFSNSTIEQCAFYDCYDMAHIGGNCNAVNFIGCQFNTPHATLGKAFWALGSGYVNVFGCEYGNGGALVGYDTGVIGMTLAIQRLAVESIGATSVVTSSNQIIIDGLRMIEGGTTNVSPFELQSGAFARFHDCSMAGFKPSATTNITMTIASPAVVTWTAHGMAVNDTVVFSTDGALPTGVTKGLTYFVTAVVDASTFRFSATRGGADVNTSGGQSGTHTGLRHLVPLAKATLSSSPLVTITGNVAVTRPAIDVYTGDDFNTFSHRFWNSSAASGVFRDDGGSAASEVLRGMTRLRLIRDSIGVLSAGEDTMDVCLQRNGAYSWEPVVNSALLETVPITGTSGNLTLNTRVKPNDASVQTVRTLPTSAKVDDEIEIICTGAAGFRLNQNASQRVRFGSSETTTGAGGYMTFVVGDAVKLKCYSASGAGYWQVISHVGTPTLA